MPVIQKNRTILIFRRWGLLFGRLVDLRCLIYVTAAVAGWVEKRTATTHTSYTTWPYRGRWTTEFYVSNKDSSEKVRRLPSLRYPAEYVLLRVPSTALTIGACMNIHSVAVLNAFCTQTDVSLCLVGVYIALVYVFCNIYMPSSGWDMYMHTWILAIALSRVGWQANSNIKNKETKKDQNAMKSHNPYFSHKTTKCTI